eukprot:comp19349_c0_seq1/m.22281 comp19349_c0_seq1/g.22281  ORF comp19349_c0_seq1/g.22281 comp19349_c0_seq1/m.22281 type:complete len:159 (-) comp19349_c0_seq1:414-890(-)
MKTIIATTIVCLAASVQVRGASKVELFSSADCTNAIPAGKNVLTSTSECVALGGPSVSVNELGTTYTYMRLSADHPNEVYLFPDAAKCAAYPPQFDPNQQVAFVRADSRDTCLPCYRCGNVKAVKIANAPDASPNSAATFAPTTIFTTFIIAAVAALF